MRALSPTIVKVARRTAAGTGAPQENTWVSDGIRSPVLPQCSLSTRHTDGEANACVTVQSFAAASSFFGFADTGREKSISGNTVVTPMAALNSANNAKQPK